MSMGSLSREGDNGFPVSGGGLLRKMFFSVVPFFKTENTGIFVSSIDFYYSSMLTPEKGERARE